MEIDTARLLEETASKWITDKDGVPAADNWPKDVRNLRHFVIVGTGGSYDYLKDSTANQRFWPVSAPLTAHVGPLAPEVARLLALSAEDPILVLPKPAQSADTDEDPPCDGVHDTGASPLYLCTRCFPYGQRAQRDLDESEDDEVQQDARPGTSGDTMSFMMKIDAARAAQRSPLDMLVADYARRRPQVPSIDFCCCLAGVLDSDEAIARRLRVAVTIVRDWREIGRRAESTWICR